MDQLESAFILVSRDYSNTSLLLELFTPHHGRLGVISKGARQRAGKGGGHLQPFIPLEVQWRGRGEIKTLTGAEAQGVALLIKGRQLYCGFYLNELLMRLTQREDPHPQLFRHYSDALCALSQCENPEPVLRRFEVDLLESLGYGVSLSHTHEGEPVRPELGYHYHLERGAVLALPNSQGILAGRTLLALAGCGPFCEQGLRQSRQLMRRILAQYLGDRPLKSRELFRSLYAGR
jgi:DNA repair protein RecO (recombination protein O)